MAYSVEMPELGESVTEGTVTQWLKKVGDTVAVDEPLLEVSTDKVDTEIPSPIAGVLLEIRANEDDTVDVGAVIAVIGEAGENTDSADATPASTPSTESAAEPEAEPEAPLSTTDSVASQPEASTPAEGTDITMPELGESVTEGTVTQWLKKVGDTVAVDEPLLEVSTDKVDTEVPSPVSGTLVEILVNEDDTVDVGAVIARIGSASTTAAPTQSEPVSSTPAPVIEEQPEASPVAATAPEPVVEERVEATPPVTSAPQEPTTGNLPYVTPLVRKLAEKHGVDLSHVVGTGVGGRIRKQDVIATAEGRAPMSTPDEHELKGANPAKSALRGTTQRVNRIREITAKTTMASLHGAAQLTQVHEADMTHISELRRSSKAAFQAKHGINLTYLPFFAKAVIDALVAHPNINASYDAETKQMTYHGTVNLGIAVDTPDGLLSPVIHDAQNLSLPEIAAAIVDLADRARNKKLVPHDIMGGTFTITNIGSEGALSDTPILVPPQAGMLGTGAIVKRAVVVSEEGQDAISIRQMVYLPLTYDHQSIDGADAGRFMTSVRDLLENHDFSGDLDL